MTGRISLNAMTSDDLDQLYDRAERAESERGAIKRAHIALVSEAQKAHQRAERAEDTIERVRTIALWAKRNYPGLDHGPRILAALDEHQEQPLPTTKEN